MKKNIAVAALTGALVLAMAAWAVAGQGWGRGYGGCAGQGAYSQLTPEKQAEADKVFEKYQSKFSELRNEMWTKRATLQAMVNGGDANEKKIAELTSEITRAKDAMQQVRSDMAEEMAQVTGIAGGGGYAGCPGYGRSNCPGYGGGRGYGRGFKGGQAF